MNNIKSSFIPSARYALQRLVLAGFAVLFASGFSHARAAQLSLSQAPTITSFKSIAPNIIFMLDDSGSMQFEYLGNKISNPRFYGFPPGTQDIYGDSNYTSYRNVAPFATSSSASNFLQTAQYRSSYVNPNYYNPATTYTPWACPAAYPESQSNPPSGAFGTNGMPPSGLVQNAPDSGSLTNGCQWNGTADEWLWPDANPATAYQNPDNTSVGYRDLKVWNDSSDSSATTANNGYAGPSSSWGSSQASSPYQFWPAVYFNYIGPRPATSTDLGSSSNYQVVQICPPSLSANSNGNTGTCSYPPPLPTSGSSPVPYHTYYNSSSGEYVYVKGDNTEVQRTYAQEIQNYANWYQYYRSHVLMARAGASQAFMKLPDGFRVDFARLNHMATSGAAPIYQTVDTFQTSERQKFLSYLYGIAIPPQGTPSRLAVGNVGQWLMQTPGSGPPWGPTPAEQAAQNSTSPLSCRQNYLVFATDGGWDGPVNSTTQSANADQTTGPTIKSATGSPYTYKPGPPYSNYSDSSLGSYSLANVAMYYWQHDLQSGMANDVPSSSADPAFWQHMTTFTIGLGVNGTLTPSDWAGLQSGSVKWPTNSCWDSGCNGNEPQQIDDLWHAAVDGHGGYLSAQNPSQFATALAGTLTNITARVASSSSVSVSAQADQEVRTGTQVYQPVYHPHNWWGELLAEPVVANATTGQVQVSTSPVWNASCVLTDSANTPSTACPTGGSTSNKSQFTYPSSSGTAGGSPSRQILTWNNGGVAFEPASSATTGLSSTQMTALGGTSVLEYLRGVRTDEQGASSTGTLRTRTSVLGDIVNSSPKWVGYPDRAYPSMTGQPTQWSDALYPSKTMPENSSAATTYKQFATAEQSRRNVVYVGANDGFLHGFSAGNYVLSNNQLQFSQKENTGQEVLAYMPSAVLSEIQQYSSPTYTHHFFADATPGTGDLFYNNAWHTWLVSGLGGGGKDLFALNITHPSKFSETNASSLVMADWTPSNITCVNDPTCASDLGYTYGTPVIRRFHNGDWGVIWGNGLNSTSGTAGIFIGLITQTGNWKIYFLNTGYGPSKDPTGASRDNGIMYATAADLDGDHVVDYVYAGDYFGNVWRFNLTSSNPSDWHVSTYGNSSPTPLFSAKNTKTAQPITTKLQVVSVPDSATGYKRLLIEFGTGSAVLTSSSTPNTTAAGVQSIYGIWDWNMKNWDTGYTTSNGVNVPADPVKYDYLSSPPSAAITRSDLQQQTITAELNSSGGTYKGSGVGSRILSSTTVCWNGSTASCPSGSTPDAMGWYLDLVSPNFGMQGEKVVYNPTVENGVLLVNTTIQSQNVGLTCTPTANSGWTMTLNPANGGSLGFGIFFNANNPSQLIKFEVNDQTAYSSGITYGAVGTPSFLVYHGQKYMVVSTRSGSTKLIKVNLGGGLSAGRLTWVELR